MRSGYRQFCAVARSLDIVGHRWTLLVVRELTLRGPLTAAAIARGLPDVPMNQLTERLARLEADGLVAVEPGGGRSRVYEITAAGRALEDVLSALGRFGLGRLAADGEPGDAVLPHVLMRQLELRFDAAPVTLDAPRGRFELVLSDPQALWSVDLGSPGPARYALVAGPDGLRARAGACLNPDASLTTTVDACARLVAGDSQAGLEVEVEGDQALAGALLHRLGGRTRTGAAAAAA